MGLLPQSPGGRAGGPGMGTGGGLSGGGAVESTGTRELGHRLRCGAWRGLGPREDGGAVSTAGGREAWLLLPG